MSQKILSPCPFCGATLGVVEMKNHAPKCRREKLAKLGLPTFNQIQEQKRKERNAAFREKYPEAFSQ